LYLDAELAQKTLRKMADLSADGSVIAQDFYSKAFSSGKYSRIANKQKSMIERMGEPWKFGIDMSNNPEAEVESFLEECGLKMTKYVQFGKKLDFEPFYCIVEAEKLAQIVW
jgi:O-methyltransferase involved in polyketide biosynthesis